MTQAQVVEFAAGPGPLIVCGRFEGVDQRVIDARNLQEVSIGDYVLSGGEIAAMALIVALGIGISAGIISAVKKDTAWDYGANIFAVYLLSFGMIPVSDNGVSRAGKGYLAMLYVCVVIYLGLVLGLLLHMVFITYAGSR